MAATIPITCPECKTTVKAAAAIEGKKVRCKSCSNVFVATAGKPAAPAKPPANAPKPAPAPVPKADDDDDDGDGTPYGLTNTDLTPRCPHCANELASADAKICHHCGYDVMKREQLRTRKIHDTTGGDVFVWLLPGILCAVGVILLIVLDIVYCLKIGDWVDTNGWIGATLASRAIKMWLCIISAFLVAGLGRFAIKRLVYDNVPPEIETKG